MLLRVSDRRDKRQGSIIYDTLAPVAAELAQQDIDIEIFTLQSYIYTMVGENLDNWAANFLMHRYGASRAVKIAEFADAGNAPFNVDLGDRFSTVGMKHNLIYRAVLNYADGQALVECETLGTAGNDYLGTILPLGVINGLKTAEIIGLQRPAQDVESDDDFRERIVERLRRKAYGGNIADYIEFTTAIEGVGGVKVFSAWQGGGTVKLSIVGGDYKPASDEFVGTVQETIDPLNMSGGGIASGLGLGIAPIGHRVSVVTPDIELMEIACTVTAQSGYALPQLVPLIEEALEGYFDALRHEWAKSESLWIFSARVSAAIMNVEGVANVSNISVNGMATDVELRQDKYVQTIPILSRVVID
jgi:uncharacterized phage protein gp47/JayE